MDNSLSWLSVTTIVAFVVALITSLLYTPVVQRLAHKYKFVDIPDGRRKVQTKPVALGGGYAVLVAGLLGIAVSCNVPWLTDSSPLTRNPSSLAGLCMAAVLLCGMGLIDDRSGLRGSSKLLWQIVAASLIIFIGEGLQFDKVLLFGYTINIGAWGIPITMMWLLGAVNSLNLLDGIDGLASTVGLIFCVTLGIMAIMTGHAVDAVIAFAVAGALLGFLRYNFAPASIYLGDAGSMFIGLVLGTIALRSTLKEAATVAFAGPLAILAIPFFDSLAAILRRKLTGRSLYSTDRGHIHHRLLTRGLSHPQAVMVIGGLCLITGSGSLASVFFAQEWIGILVVLVVFAILISARIFGHTELVLLNKRLMGFGRFAAGSSGAVVDTSVQLQGSLKLDPMWEALVESADRFNLTSIRLNLFLPRLHEHFFATWKRKSDQPAECNWAADFPLVIDGETVGRLEVNGVQKSESMTTLIGHYLDFLEPLESQLQNLLQEETEIETDDSEESSTSVESIDHDARPA